MERLLAIYKIFTGIFTGLFMGYLLGYLWDIYAIFIRFIPRLFLECSKETW